MCLISSIDSRSPKSDPLFSSEVPAIGLGAVAVYKYLLMKYLSSAWTALSDILIAANDLSMHTSLRHRKMKNYKYLSARIS